MLGPLLVHALLAAAPGGADRVVVAVFPIQDSAEVLEPKAEQSLTDYFGVKLAESGRFIIVPRADLEAALKQQKAESYDACYDQRCQIEIGKELAAQKVLHTQIVKVGDSCAVASTIYDLRMGAAEAAASERGGCSENDLVISIEKVVRILGTKTSGGGSVATPGPPAPPPPAAPPPPTRPTFSLRVTAEPSSADVLIDGRRQGTGVGVNVPLEPGTAHQLTVESDGYVTHTETVRLERDERRAIVLAMTAERRASRSEWFGLSASGGALASAAWTVGAWIRLLHLSFGGFRWSVLEAHLGYLSGKSSVTDFTFDEDDCTAAEIRAAGYCRVSDSAFSFFLGSRVGWSLGLSEDGSSRLELGLSPGLYVVTGTDDETTALALSPSVQYVSMSDGAFAWGVGLRAIVPYTGSCPLEPDSEQDIAILETYTKCQNAHPMMFLVEVPLGWYL